jgi:hypothetical protein
VIYNVHGTAAAPLEIRRSFFEHNHRDDVYYTCGAGHEKCAGGQLLLAGLVDFLRVENTVIRNGSDDGFPSPPVDGVEINFPDMHDITFAGDDVHTNTSWESV